MSVSSPRLISLFPETLKFLWNAHTYHRVFMEIRGTVSIGQRPVLWGRVLLLLTAIHIRRAGLWAPRGSPVFTPYLLAGVLALWYVPSRLALYRFWGSELRSSHLRPVLCSLSHLSSLLCIVRHNKSPRRVLSGKKITQKKISIFNQSSHVIKYLWAFSGTRESTSDFAV